MAWNQNIRMLRERNNLTQQQLADRLYVSRQTVCRWESGSRCPDLTMAKRIAEAFQVTMDELLSEEDAEGCPESCGFSYPRKLVALERQRAQGGKLRELIQMAAGICVGIEILVIGAYDMEIPGWILGLEIGVKAALCCAYFMVSGKLRKI